LAFARKVLHRIEHATMEASLSLLLLFAASTVNAVRLGGTPTMRRAMPQMVATSPQVQKDEISAENPLHVLIAGAGVGGLALANQLELSNAHVTYTVLE
jgi:zeaxanthin epoxidase